MAIAASQPPGLLQTIPGGPVPYALVLAALIPWLLRRGAAWSGLNGLATIGGGAAMLAGWLLLAPSYAGGKAVSLFESLLLLAVVSTLLLPWRLPSFLSRAVTAVSAGKSGVPIISCGLLLLAAGWWLARVIGIPVGIARWAMFALAGTGAVLLLDGSMRQRAAGLLTMAACLALTLDACRVTSPVGLRWSGLAWVVATAALGTWFAGGRERPAVVKRPAAGKKTSGASHSTGKKNGQTKQPALSLGADRAEQEDHPLLPLQCAAATLILAVALVALHPGGASVSPLSRAGYAAGLIWLPPWIGLFLFARFRRRGRFLKPEPVAAMMAVLLTALVTYSAAALTGLR
ncbi:Hypothetical protein GbCGDNIH9_0340 [Granulibacter bethesdensis]|uniref:Uncharacterized protein n=1 Tax=Granulibacter bethesdensis TaxID=364410 RepID=A0AAC9P827_9PROT|nr:hypothetical protein [Granulibacter bethesdensis]APH53569.1 Hypothetical protein GbCGDNIH9_0340 [Granulibacter bethesdensis]APH61147.1 Hypothetical protein GbCGDNIH8_0340 [Granulibacter bethesdensis]